MGDMFNESDASAFWAKVNKTPTCWLWMYSLLSDIYNSGGYGQVTIRNRRLRAHRVAWELTNGPIPDGLHVLHRCDVRHCVNPDHLFLGTDADNIHDAMAKGRFVPPPVRYGEQHGLSKLTADDVATIRALYASKSGWTHRSLGEKFNVTHTNICHILNNRTWIK